MEYDAAGNDLDRLMSDGEDLREALQGKATQLANYWTANSRKRTGFNSRSVVAYTGHDEDGNLVSVTYAFGHYARFREHGTRYNAAERVMRDGAEMLEAM
ncbi:hypothetical protein [Rhodococcus rhodochrous]|uniref:hypothetical protein n=1 Tax=Rhodococcus rhodochrous TaxID=1829 RepID=UPI001781E4CD|nr:hypothetical protein [Rhodococcus rhodochrous]QOH59890.1 hypothetical protein C6Y44_27760 [Rhodococcus rhodochrous]